jgi:hypothetical protein
LGSADSNGGVPCRSTPIRWTADVTIQDLGSIGELLAAAATIATLIYLARQLRANTAAVQGDARRAHRAASSATNLAIASDTEVAALFNVGLKDFSALSPEHHTQFAFLMTELIGSWQAAHEEFESGIVDERPLQRQSAAHAPFLRMAGGRRWWDKYRNAYPPEFRDFVDAQIETPTD